jgi:hypothetical protein
MVPDLTSCVREQEEMGPLVARWIAAEGAAGDVRPVRVPPGTRARFPLVAVDRLRGNRVVEPSVNPRWDTILVTSPTSAECRRGDHRAPRKLRAPGRSGTLAARVAERNLRPPSGNALVAIEHDRSRAVAVAGRRLSRIGAGTGSADDSSPGPPIHPA